jgi:ferredoxin
MAAKIDKKNCTGCGKCVEVCPVAAIKVEKEKAIVNNDCVECGACVGECPHGAISIPR